MALTCRVVIILSMDIVGQQGKIGEPKQYVGDPSNEQAQPSNGHPANGVPQAGYESMLTRLSERKKPPASLKVLPEAF